MLTPLREVTARSVKSSSVNAWSAVSSSLRIVASLRACFTRLPTSFSACSHSRAPSSWSMVIGISSSSL